MSNFRTLPNEEAAPVLNWWRSFASPELETVPVEITASGEAWRQSDLELLEAMYATSTAEAIGALLYRSARAVRTKAKALGLTRAQAA